MSRAAGLVGICLFMVASYEASAEDRPPLSNAEIQALVERLASPNKAPRMDVGDNDGVQSMPIYSASFKHEAQEAVARAEAELIAQGPTAFPQLIAQVGDKRYCLTELREKNWWANVTVGQVCRQIVARQVEVFEPLLSFPPPGRNWIPYHVEGVKEWWKENQGRSLRDMQLAGAKWAVEQETTRFKEWREHVADATPFDPRTPLPPPRPGQERVERPPLTVKELERLREDRVREIDGRAERRIARLNALVKRLEDDERPIQRDAKGKFVDETFDVDPRRK